MTSWLPAEVTDRLGRAVHAVLYPPGEGWEDIAERRRDALRAAAAAVVAVLLDPDNHTYISTACLHGDHRHCSTCTLPDGRPKEPATCKFCRAPCVCVRCADAGGHHITEEKT